MTLALDIAKRLDAGMSHINGTRLDDEAQIPLGDVKDSGYGRSGGALRPRARLIGFIEQ